MDLVTLKDWVYPTLPTHPWYVPDDAVGRESDPLYSTPSPKQPGVYTPLNLIEGYTSLIWKESFAGTNGTFELKTYDVQKTLDALPKGTLVSLLDTDEVYIVTTRHIGTDEGGVDTLTVSGVSILKFLLDNRITWSYDPTTPTPIRATNVNLNFRIPDHLAFILWSGLVFHHREGGVSGGKPFELPYDITVPHTAVSQSLYDPSKGDLYSTEWPPPIEYRITSINDLMALTQRFGVRTIRPRGGSAWIYKPSLASKFGEYDPLVMQTNIDKMLFDVYEGLDRTKADANRIVFRHDAGDIVSSEFLDSIETFKNVVNSHAEVDPTKTAFSNMFPPVVSKIHYATGLPGSTPADNVKPGTQFLMGEVASTADLKNYGLNAATSARMSADAYKYLRDNKRIDMLTADISPDTQYKYKVHYNLGDIVYVQGKYGGLQKMVVSEYTRTSENIGESGYPTLVRWEDPSGST
ncbi:minor tail protein [Rhodococcus phage ReqiPepy6]|uniref:Gp037 n=1 Tax=Rhodococcus phage ReqiPepy6 TaxID=691965 RepID=D4P7E8_9CAUD|nr:minor tail protein [Rhodococcus phage ReqiPepy6]ADD80928.1 gp037 [Rhodococcus phage ReqiPepy6]